jgi:hypothetical protein
MLDDIDREAEREGCAMKSLRSYSPRRRGDGRSDPYAGRVKLPNNIDIDVVRILKILRTPNGSD